MKFITAMALLATGATAVPTGSGNAANDLAKRAPICSDFTGFNDNSTSSSPLVGDCLRILDRPPQWDVFTYDVEADPRWLNLWSFKDCMFGARAKTVDTQFNTDDVAHLAAAALAGKDPTDRIEGSGVVTCGEGEVEWAFYNTRNSEWA
ncbi:hypothetical protein QBC34DRAFT_440133 [Podospora aff. communis PSN243]|uniref:Ecp2 effector protein-like domain-containing protein n=1 Tax=Podospora aff. communis PSN243 TaxID=3040156 RepID=A0AAV9GFY3_9PEZI|nr:hypothetical protein QBC34DRAFT_440133 [Podospora aff. communis PSN243]